MTPIVADTPTISAKQIAAFRAVMEAGSITDAAELMYITQPAISGLIRDLKLRIGFSLFERQKGNILAVQGLHHDYFAKLHNYSGPTGENLWLA